MPTQLQLLRTYRANVKRSKQWRADNYDDEWHRYIDLYRGKQVENATKQDRLIVNLIWSTINTLAPAVAVNNPKFVVNARRPEAAAQAIVTEEVLNYVWRTYHYQDEFRLAVNDWLINGHGWCKIGYKFTKPPESKKAPDSEQTDTGSNMGGDQDASQYGVDDREDIEGNVESQMYVASDRPFVERISIFDMFSDPDARHPKEMCFIAQRVWRPVNDVKVDDRYERSARTKVTGTKWSRWSTNGDTDGRADQDTIKGTESQYVEVIEYYDIKRGLVATFALDGNEDDNTRAQFLIKPQPMPYAQGHPFVMLRGFEVPDSFYPIGDVAQIESLQLELNETRSQMMNHRKRFQRKWLYEKDAFDRDGVAALESDVDNTMIPVMSDGNPANVIAPLPAVITPSDFYDQSGMITNDIDRVSGISDYQRGAAQTNIKRTATEAAMIQDASNSRAQDRLAKVESILGQVAERIIGLMQQYMTGDQVARIVTIPARAWVNYDADYIKGEFDYDVVAGSTEPQNETFRRQSAMQMVDASMPFLQMGVANPLGLYIYILQRGFGVKDVTQFVIPPKDGAPDEQLPTPDGQMAPQQPGQQNAPPPGQPPAPGGGVPPQAGGPPEQMGIPPAMLQGAAPIPADRLTAPQMPQTPDDIPIEMLMQMLGSGAAMR